MSTPSVYFEISWSILSTWCLGNVLLGLIVCGITSFTRLAAVPIITSAAGAIANGICYYVYYGSHPALNRAIASVFGDIFWLMQEAGLSFYSYIILQRVLQGFRLRVFSALFWLIMVAICVTRAIIAAYRVRSIIEDDEQLQVIINYLHISYFSLMAILECISAYFLITVFTSATNTSLGAALKVGLFRYLTRSTEIRVAILAVQGVMRTITHSFQTPGQRADNIASQLDRFTYTLVCLYPAVLYIDLLASKLRFKDQTHGTGSNIPSFPGTGSRSRARQYPLTKMDSYSMGRCEHVVEVRGGKEGNDRNSSQEQIIPAGSSHTGMSEGDIDEIDGRGNVITKTVEIKVL